MNSTTQPFVRAEYAWCSPGGRPLVPPVLSFAAAFAFAGLFRATAFFAYKAFPHSQSYLPRIGRLAAQYAVVARKETFSGAVVNLEWFVTLSEQWMLEVSRLCILVCSLLSVALAGACFLEPLPLTCVILGNVAVCKVAFSAFKKKEHGISAALTVEIHAFILCTCNACFVRLETSLAPGTWAALLALTAAADAGFLLYPGIVAALKHRAPLKVSAYLVLVELLAFSLAFATLALVTTQTFLPG